MKNKFIPAKQAELMAKAGQFHAKITAPGFDPATIGLTAGDVTRFTTKYTAAQAALAERDAAITSKQSKTDAFSGPGAAYEQLVGEFRYQGNKVRVSDAADDTCTNLGVSRRDGKPTRKTAPAVPPEFTVDNAIAGAINVRFREAGSASPRARATSAIGVQIATVDAAKPVADGEAEAAPVVFAPRSPAQLDSTRMPAEVRLYARWVTQRGEVSPWSLPLDVTVL